MQKKSGFCFVDLAGSEKTSKLECQNEQDFKESCQINNSLLSLGRCLTLLKEGKTSLPTRDCTLTLLLMGYLTEGNNVALLSNISQDYANFEETVKVLQYASDSNRTILPKMMHNPFFYSQAKPPAIKETCLEKYSDKRLSVVLENLKKTIDLREVNTKLSRWSTMMLREIDQNHCRQSMLINSEKPKPFGLLAEYGKCNGGSSSGQPQDKQASENQPIYKTSFFSFQNAFNFRK